MNRLLLLFLFSLTLIACSPTTVGPQERAEPAANPHLVRADMARVESPTVAPETMAALVEGHNQLSLDLYQTAAAGHEENIFFSPYSIQQAFSMVYAGARQETEAQMADVLHLLPQAEHHVASNALDQQLAALGSDLELADEDEAWFQLEIANALWGQEGYPLADAYLETLAQQYGAGLRLLDFVNDPETARQIINEWVATQTEGKIDQLLPPDMPQPDTRLILTNAIYFNASWQFPFDPQHTEEGTFTRLDGRQLTVPMMQQENARRPYTAGEGYQAIRLPYVGYAMELLIILPEEGHFSRIESELSPDFIAEIRRQTTDHMVDLMLPRFEMEADLDLRQTLLTMGLDNPFGSTADFSGISPEGDLFISDALHQATITVDEVGTEAAAATGIGVVTSEPPQATMTIDRPFILAIVTRDPQTILFLGRVMDIE
jgi:serpin B